MPNQEKEPLKRAINEMHQTARQAWRLNNENPVNQKNNLLEPSSPKTSPRWKNRTEIASTIAISLLVAVGSYNLAESAGICNQLFIAGAAGTLAAIACMETCSELPDWINGARELFRR